MKWFARIRRRGNGLPGQDLDSFDVPGSLERRTIFLQYINRGWLLFGIVTLAASLFLPAQRVVFVYLMAVIFPGFLVTQILLDSGSSRLAGMLFTLLVNFCFYGLFLLLTRQLGAEKAFETQIPVLMLMGLAVLFAGALIDKWSAPFLALVNTVLIVGTRLSLAPSADPRPAPVVFWWMLALTIWLYERTLERAFARVLDELSERQLAEVALRAGEEQYRSLVEKIPGAVILHLAAHPRRDVYVSPGIKDLLGYSPEEWMQDRAIWRNSIHALDLDRVQAEDARTDESREAFRIEYRMLRRDGKSIWISEHASLISNRTGEPLYWQCLLLDINDRKQIEQERESLIDELKAKNAELERFTYTVSHDLKTPLVTIKGFLGYLQRDAESGNLNRFTNDTHRIASAVDLMAGLLNDLLELSRIGRLMNEPRQVQFGHLVQDVLELLHTQIQDRGVAVRVQEVLPDVFGDRQRLFELVQNLVENAVKFMADQPQPCIEIGCQGEEDHKSVFFVRDNGRGIPPEHFDRVFGLFNKLDPHSPGTGIGLALVKRIVELHSGRIWVEGEAGKGSTFFFTLPPGPVPDSVI